MKGKKSKVKSQRGLGVGGWGLGVGGWGLVIGGWRSEVRGRSGHFYICLNDKLIQVIDF